MKQSITLEHTIDAGHRIVGHKGKCARLHGHTYKFEIEIWGSTQDPGFIIDFGDVKDLLNEWDHHMLLWSEDPLWGPKDNPFKREQLLGSNGVLCLPYNPTAENMAKDVCMRIMRSQVGLEACDVTLWETPKAGARCYFTRG